MQGAPLDVDRIREEFGGEVRLFPLPHLVLFPDAFAPLKVFEDRYVDLINDAREDDGLVGMALLDGSGPPTAEGEPAIHPTVCVGRILRHHQLPSGKSDVLLYGLFRARVLAEIDGRTFRRARVEVIDDVAPPTSAEEIARRVRRAFDLVPGRRSVVWEMRRMANHLRGIDATAGRYADAVANASDLLPDDRYALLAEPDVLRRLERLIQMLEARAYAGAPRIPPGTKPSLN
jgi:Lon protease-like protein